MIGPTEDPDPEGDGERMTLTLSMYKYQRDWIENRAEERDMSLSEYVRTMTTAGERQLVAIERLADEDGRGEIEADLLDILPEDESNAVPPEELLDEVTDPIEEMVYTILTTNSQIQDSPKYGGYYLDDG